MKKNIIKKCVGIFTVALCVASMVGCTNKTSKDDNKEPKSDESVVASSEKKDELDSTNIDVSGVKFVEDGKLTVGMVVDYLPFEYYPSSGSAPIGVDVDIVKALSKKLGLEVEIKDVPWDDNLFINLGSDYDIVCSAITVTDERLKDMIFSDSYIDSYQSVVIRTDSGISIERFEDLAGLKVAVQKDTVSSEMMNEYISNKKVDIKLFENEIASDCFDELINGKVDAVVCDSTVTDGEVARNINVLKEAYRDESQVEHFAIAIAKDNKEMQKVINDALKNLQEDGTTQKIIRNWFGR